MKQDSYVYAKQKKRITWGWYLGILMLFSVPFIVLRTYQQYAWTNMNTGFFNGSAWTINLLYGGIFLFAAIVIVFAIIDKRTHVWHFTGSRLYIGQAFSIATGLFMLVNAITIWYSWLTGQNPIPMAPLVALLEIVAAIALFYLPTCLKGTKQRKADIILCVPCLWSCAVLLSMFFQHTAMTTVSENVLNILRVSAQTLFFICFAKSISGCETRNTGRWMDVSGILSVLLGLLTTLPLFINMLLGNVYLTANVLITGPTEFLVLLFTAFFVFCDLCRKE